jgi:signal transduction histidine kinase
MAVDSTRTGVWCATQERGVYHIDQRLRVTRLCRMVDGWIEPLNGARNLCVDRRNRLWFSTSHGLLSYSSADGWHEFNTSTGYNVEKCTWAAVNEAAGEIWTRTGGWEVFIMKLDGTSSRTMSLASYVSTKNTGHDNTLFTMVSNPKSGGLWIVSSAGVFAVDGPGADIRFFPISEVGGYVYFTPSTDSKGNLWYVHREPGAESYEYRKLSWKDGSVLTSTGTHRDFTRMLPFGTLCEDRDGSVWIGADGLAHLRSMDIINYHLSWKGMPSVPRNSAIADDGRVLISTWGGVYAFARDRLKAPVLLTATAGKPGVPTSMIMKDRNGMLHWTQQNAGSYVYAMGSVRPDRRDGALTIGGHPYRDVAMFAITNDGSMAFVPLGMNHGISWVHPDNRITNIVLPLASGTERVDEERICATRKYGNKSNTVFLLTDRHIYEIRDGVFIRRSDNRPELTPGDQASICEDSSGTIWIGSMFPTTDVVLRSFDGVTYRFYTASDLGIEQASIRTLVAHPDRKHMVIGTFHGAYFIDLKDMRVHRRLTQEEGLASNVINDLLITPDSIVWILTEGGASRYREMPMDTMAIQSPTIITDFTADNYHVPFPAQSAHFELNRIPGRIDIAFSTLCHSMRFQYQTMLLGNDTAWSAPSYERDVHYLNLQPGTYIFNVRPYDPVSGRAGKPATLVISVPLPFFREYWFIALILVLTGIIVYAFHRLRFANKKSMESMRRAIALDIHDEIGSTLTSISFMSAMAEKELPPDQTQVKNRINKIGETSRQVIELISDIIWSLRPELDGTSNLDQRLKDFSAELSESSGISIRTRIDNATLSSPMRMDWRRNLYLIVKEAVHNAVKHSECTTIDVALEERMHRLELTITDNGKGFPDNTPAHKTGSNTGLGSMRKRAEEMGGVFFLEKAEGGGTVIRVSVPR